MPHFFIKNSRSFSGIAIAVLLWVSIGLPFTTTFVRAADGSGTNSVSPTSVNVGSAGNTETFTFTAAETMDSGEVAITVPAGWTAPQGTSGTAGYTTATSAAGTIGTVLDNGDSISGWAAGTACANGLVLDTSIKHEGTGSMRCDNGDQGGGHRWYKNISAQDWSGYTKVAFWVRVSVTIPSIDTALNFAYDNDDNLASPIELKPVGLLTADTWTYVVLDFGSTTRTSITSFGFYIDNKFALDDNSVWIDDILIGPGLPTFPGGGDIRVRPLQLASGQTMTVTYGSGGGSSGATAPASGETSVFTTKTRVSDAGTLASIAASPTVTVNNPEPTTTGISPTSKAAGEGAFTMTVNGTNFVPTSVVRFNGSDRATTYVSATQLTASILAGDVATAGSFTITVFNPTPGGGTSNGQTFTVTADTTAPAAITDLALSGPTTSSIVLTWTAPGDDGSTGTAALYDIRYSTSPITTDGDFTSASLVSGEPSPAVAGTSQNMTVTGLSASTLYYFAMKTQDEVPNVSTVSNVPSLSTAAASDTTAPAATTDLALSSPTTSSIVLTWTAPGDDGSTGTAALYDIRYSTSPITTDGDFTSASLVSGEPTPAVAGTSQNMTVTGLSANTLYYFAMKTQDEVPNVSSVSNVPSLSTTQVSGGSSDRTPPAAITDLVLSGVTTSSMVLTWTAPGDDGNVGQAHLYDIRYSTSPIATASDFFAATLVTGEPVPTTAGTTQSMTVSGLTADTYYYFAMTTQDEVPNVSPVSSVPELSTHSIGQPDGDTTPPAISNVSAVSITQTSVSITWETNDIADSLVRFGPNNSLGGTAFDGELVTNHAVPITKLSPGSTYRYTVCSSDTTGNQACLSEFIFTTLPADAPKLAYSAAEALAAAPTINVDKSLVAPPPGTATLCVSGSLIKAPSDGNPLTQADSTVYYCAAGKRYVFPDADTYHSWYADFSGITVVSASDLAAVPLGGNVTYRPGKRMLKIQSDPKTYAVAKGDVLRWVTTEGVARALYGLVWKDMIKDISDAFFINYVLGDPITEDEVVPVPAPSAACTTTTTFTRFLSRGSTDPQVRPLQALLECLGYFPSDVEQTGHFGPATEDAVNKFQTANSIDAFGYVGPATREALNRYTKE